MIKAVLLDLDNTLLINPDYAFAAEYLRRVDVYFEAQWQFKGMSRVIRKMLGQLAGVRPPQLSNDMFSLQIITEAAQCAAADAKQAFADFYAGDYQTLRNCIKPVACAPDLITYLKDKGYTVVIATNPLYPAEAVRSRMQWAGIDDDFASYAFVTHAENMHFIKPHPAYYAEILARIGVEPDEAIMVGDSLDNDINAAATIGIHTFQISDDENSPADAHGTLQDFFDKVKNEQWLDQLIRQPLQPYMIEPQLLGNVGALFGLLMGIKDHYWSQHPDPEEWSVLQIICHLVESENNVQRPRLEKILREDNPFLAQPPTPPGPRQFHCEGEGMENVDKFVVARQKTIEFLSTLKPEDWQRPARHSIFGLTNLLEMAHFTAQHDRLHLNQLCQTVGNCR